MVHGLRLPPFGVKVLAALFLVFPGAAGWSAVELLSARLPRNPAFERQLELFTQKANFAIAAKNAESVALQFKGDDFSLAAVLLAKKRAGHPPALALVDHQEVSALGSAIEKRAPFLSTQLVLAVKQPDSPSPEKKSWEHWLATQKLGVPLLGKRALFLLSRLIPHPLYRRLPGGVQANRENFDYLRALQRWVNANRLVLNVDRETLLSRWVNGEFSAIWCFSDDLKELKARTPFAWTTVKGGVVTPNFSGAKGNARSGGHFWQIDLVQLQPHASASIWMEQWPRWMRLPQMREGFQAAGFFPPSVADSSLQERQLPKDPDWIRIQNAWIKGMTRLFSPQQSPEVSQFFTAVDQELGNLKP